jgi:hypothetical protein
MQKMSRIFSVSGRNYSTCRAAPRQQATIFQSLFILCSSVLAIIKKEEEQSEFLTTKKAEAKLLPRRREEDENQQDAARGRKNSFHDVRFPAVICHCGVSAIESGNEQRHCTLRLRQQAGHRDVCAEFDQ